MSHSPHRPPHARAAVVVPGPWAAEPVHEGPAAPTVVRLHRSRSGFPDRQVRLVVRWLELARHAAAVAAHGRQPGLPGETELLDLLDRVEELVCEQVNDGRGVLDELTGWVAALDHEAAAGPGAGACLVCRRGRAVPEQLRGDLALAIHLTMPPVATALRRAFQAH